MLLVLVNLLNHRWGGGGSLIFPIKKVGRAERAEFTISNLSAWLRKFEVETNLLSILWTRGIKSSTLGLVVPIGKPKYVKRNVPMLQPNVLARW
jgi:hypothetical protein